MSSLAEVRVPDLGNFDSVAVIDVLVKPGDTIDIDTPLVTLETDKATMDVPSTAKGVVEKVHVSKGGTVSPGALIVTVKSAASEPAAQPAAKAAAPAAATAPAPAPAAPPPAASSIDVSVPDMGGFDSVGVIDVLVKPGDTVDIDTPLVTRSEEHTSELQSQSNLVCRLLLEKKKKKI